MRHLHVRHTEHRSAVAAQPATTGRRPSPAPIVVGVDSDQAALGAVAWGAREAARLGRPLLLVHALGRGTQDAFDAGAIDQDFRVTIDRLRADGERHLAEATHLARAVADVPVRTAIRLTSPHRALLEASRNAHQVVLGPRHGAAGTATVESALGLVVAHASCPVVVVDDTRPGGDVELGVLALADDSESGRQVVATAAALAETADERLTIVPARADARDAEAQAMADELAAIEDELFGARRTVALLPGIVAAEQRRRRVAAAAWTLVPDAEATPYLEGERGWPSTIVVDSHHARRMLHLVAVHGAPARTIVVLPAVERPIDSLEEVLSYLQDRDELVGYLERQVGRPARQVGARVAQDGRQARAQVEAQVEIGREQDDPALVPVRVRRTPRHRTIHELPDDL